ncbi:hypothetical protein INT47_005411 [Mucor saturninus]|uniref:Reverse transcriptase domain-containing protein n=1 Tax=Mucor saturninus TaxID=64648 RepID=A0A8H7UU63_9FUNG|nr:hypothetical protein INT47_005411 [Mucor saturninus]
MTFIVKVTTPISPLLFNIAFDPFLRSVQQATNFQGFSFPSLVSEPSPEPLKVMAYADDTLVFLETHQDFNCLEQLITQYALASNAKLNFAKTQAFPLSGKASQYWTAYLHSWETPITSWHDRHSPNALTYLGYPLYFNASQKNLAIDILIQKIQRGCDIHSKRNLSIKGRTVVLNTLLLSKLWHVLRIVPLTKGQIDRLRGICSSFLNASRFPRIAYRNFVPYKTKGGVGILDPLVQQLKLHWRWLADLIIDPTVLQLPQHHHRSFLHTSVPYLKYGLSLIASGGSSSYIWPLLFSTKRRGFRQLTTNSFTILFSLMDSLPNYDLSQSNLSLATFLQLDLASIVIPAPNTPVIPASESIMSVVFPRNSASMSKTLVCDFFIVDPHTHIFRQRSDRETRFPTLLRKFRVAIANGYIQPTSNFEHLLDTSIDATGTIDLRPLLESQMSTYILAFDKPKQLAVMLRDSLFPPKPTTTFSVDKWKTFWSLPISPSILTVWYRAIHHKLPNKSLLHNIVPESFPSATCIHCPQTEDTLHHFLYDCPTKKSIWLQCLSTFFPDVPIVPGRILSILLSFDYGDFQNKRSTVATSLSFISIIGCILLGIWRSHWKLVFDDQPFTTTTVLSLCSSIVWQLHFQSLVD